MPDWDPQQYLKFKKERTQPALDLAARLELSPAKALDVGCGPGNSTQVVAERFPHAQVLGLDASASMVRAAHRAHPQLEFIQCDVSSELDRLPSHQAIMDWYSSTGLRPYLEAAVDEEARQGFYEEVFRQVKEAYPVQENGEIIFRFPRLFFTAVKP